MMTPSAHWDRMPARFKQRVLRAMNRKLLELEKPSMEEFLKAALGELDRCMVVVPIPEGMENSWPPK